MSVSIEIVGNAGGDPSTTAFQDGGESTTVSVAVNQGYFDRDNNWVDQGTAWYRVTLRSDQARQQAKFINKGVKLIISGTLKVRAYQDKQGVDRQSLEVMARHVGIVHTEPRRLAQQWGSSPKQWSGRRPQASAGQSHDPWGGAGNDNPVF